jgi:GT2 family glycosyltransferase
VKICAIVLDYRGAERTEACLRSLLQQGIIKVVVVDNSDDRQASAMLDQAIGRLRKDGTDYELHILRPAENLGFGGGVNLALKDGCSQDCDGILLINNDATAAPGMVSKLSMALLDRNLDVAAPVIVDGFGREQPMLWYQRFFGLLSPNRLPASFSYLSGCCLLVRRTVAMPCGLFDEDFFMYGEDTLLGWRLIRSGKKAQQINGAVVHHIGIGSSQQCKLFYEYHTARAHVLLALKTRRHPFEIPFLVAGKMLGLSMRALVRSLRYKSGVPLLAFLLAWIPLDIRSP